MNRRSVLIYLFSILCSCAKPVEEPPFVPNTIPYENWESVDEIELLRYSHLSFAHQSAAAYGNYVFFITEGRADVCMYNLARKRVVEYLSVPGEDAGLFHCNQSSFGVDFYTSSDPFPLLYVSQRAGSDGRCFVEVFRVVPDWDDRHKEYTSFSMDLVQTIYFPEMTYSNSLGNVNCVINRENRLMYTYSRNNRARDDNFGICKISAFRIPPFTQRVVYLEDEDIQDSFMIEQSAVNMQGGTILNGLLYIGQGFQSAGYINLLVVDLNQKKLIRRFDLMKKGVTWEPQGCFNLGESILLSGWRGIYEVMQIHGNSVPEQN